MLFRAKGNLVGHQDHLTYCKFKGFINADLKHHNMFFSAAAASPGTRGDHRVMVHFIWESSALLVTVFGERMLMTVRRAASASLPLPDVRE